MPGVLRVTSELRPELVLSSGSLEKRLRSTLRDGELEGERVAAGGANGDVLRGACEPGGGGGDVVAVEGQIVQAELPLGVGLDRLTEAAHHADDRDGGVGDDGAGGVGDGAGEAARGSLRAERWREERPKENGQEGEA